MIHRFSTSLCCEACGLLLTHGVHRDVRDCGKAFCLIRDTLQAALVQLALNDVRFRQDIDLRQDRDQARFF